MRREARPAFGDLYLPLLFFVFRRISPGRGHPRGSGRRRARHVARRLLARGNVAGREPPVLASHIGPDVAVQVPGRSRCPAVVHPGHHPGDAVIAKLRGGAVARGIRLLRDPVDRDRAPVPAMKREAPRQYSLTIVKLYFILDPLYRLYYIMSFNKTHVFYIVIYDWRLVFDLRVTRVLHRTYTCVCDQCRYHFVKYLNN